MIRPDPKPPKPVLLNAAGRRALKVELYNGRANERCENRSCRKWVELNKTHMDVFRHCHLSHIIPRKRGGDSAENCQILCWSCHLAGVHGPRWKTKRGT